MGAAYHCVKAVLPQMLERGHGCVVAISSGVSQYPPPGASAHAVAKAALNAFMRSLALELGPAGIRVNTIAPGLIMTDNLNIPWHWFRLIAIPEIAASGGLLAGLAVAPLGAAAAIGLVLLMAGALSFRILVHDRFPLLLGDAAFLLLAAAAAALRIITA
jgi:NAD(P)-dependent dehydrogenase (short-subunit alcohol dehydrogenase family)